MLKICKLCFIAKNVEKMLYYENGEKYFCQTVVLLLQKSTKNVADH